MKVFVFPELNDVDVLENERLEGTMQDFCYVYILQTISAPTRYYTPDMLPGEYPVAQIEGWILGVM